MKKFSTMVVLTSLFCLNFSFITVADTLIYNNSTIEGGFLPMDSSVNDEFLDYGSSPGGLVSKFEIGYATTITNPGTLYVRFWGGTTKFQRGNPIKTITISDLEGPAYPDGYAYPYFREYILPEEDRFALPSGSFGYSYDFSWSYDQSGPLSAYGGSSNEDYFWWYYINTWYGQQQVGGGYAGFYMKVYTAPPIEDVTCDIEGNKFDDVDGDGVWDAEEPGLGGWEIYVDTNGNDQFDPGVDPNAVTDPNGLYFFENLDSPATYTIREVMKNGWTQILPGGPDYEYTIVTEPNTLYESLDFGNTDQVLIASVYGTITHDSNQDSILNPSEPRLAGWTVYADINGNTRLDAGEPSAETDANGEYQLTVSAPGTYSIAEQMQEGWVQTYPTAACTHTVTITAPGQIVENIDFGNDPFTGYGGGSGTLNDPYLIYNHLHLQAVGAHSWDYDKHFELMDDIDLSKYTGEQFNMIGKFHYIVSYDSFNGVCEGNGYTVNNFSYNYTNTAQMHVGLFGHVWNGEIRNLRMENVTILTQGSGVAGAALVGYLDEGSMITDCHVAQGTVTTESSFGGAAGLIGKISDGTVSHCSVVLDGISGSDAGGITYNNYEGNISNCSFEGNIYALGSETGETLIGGEGGGIAASNQSVISQCYANATVDGIGRLGGLVGENSSGGVISQCYTQGNVYADSPPEMGLAGSEAGGLVGYHSDGEISDCYSMAAVTGDKKIGGLIGVCWGDTDVPTDSVVNCYATGAVSGSYTKGGLVGWNIDGYTEITGCFWDTQTSDLTYSDGGTGLLTEDMQDIQTYLNAGWDLDTIWWICEDVYPRLRWQPRPVGDFVCPDGVEFSDLMVLCDEWLEILPVYTADIAPEGAPDGKVNLLDFALFSEYWNVGF